jgi:hypothetical protein
MRGATGTTSPLQSGQWLPHPAPDPLARTYAPHSTTSTFHASTPHAKRLKFALCVRAGDATVAANFHSSKPVKIVGRAQRSFVGDLVLSLDGEQHRAE